MSRRDTIIIAVLVNAGLLMILFATAIRSDGEKKPKISDQTTLCEATVVQPEPAEQEDILADYAAPPTLAAPTEELVFDEAIQSEPAPVAVEENVLLSPQPQPLPEPVKEQPSHVNVTVKKGDALEKIARANKTTVAAIMQANSLSSTQLKIGQVLRVPLSGSVKPSQKKSAAPTAPADGNYYIVKEGDNPWVIASRNNVTVSELLRLNGLDEQKAKRLRPGDRLRIR